MPTAMASEISKNGAVIFARIGIHKPEDWPSGVFRVEEKFTPANLIFLTQDVSEGVGMVNQKNCEQEQQLIKLLENIPKPAQ